MITVAEGISLITLRNIPNRMEQIAQVFSAVAGAGVNVDMISQTQAHKSVVDLSFTVEDQDLAEVISVLGAFQKSGMVSDVLANCAKLVYMDEQMCVTPGYGAKIFTLLAQNSIEALIITTSVTDVSVLLEQQDLERAKKLLEMQL